jgi:Chemoreceptor zinc-binding domain
MNRAEIDSAIGAHGLWKGRLRSAIQTGKCDITVTTAHADDQCAFGKWLKNLDGEGSKSAHYRSCRDLHTQFHAKAADVLALALAGKKDDANRAIAPGSEFNNVSIKLTREMMDWAEGR